MINVKSKKDCCGCNACVSICPVSAITMKEDENGFVYPVIDEQLCVSCGKCDTVCQYKSDEIQRKKILQVYAAVAKDMDIYNKSTSAGVFTLIAKQILTRNGVVFGAALDKDPQTNSFVCHHVQVDNISDLSKLQGSKYVQSDINMSFEQCKKKLDDGVSVLFSGTPCQIAGLYLFLGKDYENLYTIDIVCHGVPNQKMFNDFIDSLESKSDVVNFRFRSKLDSGHNIMYETSNNGKTHLKVGYCYCYCYYAMFLSGKNYRENCFECRFAQKADERMGDLSLCDFWGLHRVHPEINKIKEFRKTNVHSGVMVNSTKGMSLLNDIKPNIALYESSFDKLRMFNEQLNYPTKKPIDYDDKLEKYRKEGYKKMETDYRKKIGIKYYIYKLFFIMPKFIKTKVRDFQWKHLIKPKNKMGG